MAGIGHNSHGLGKAAREKFIATVRRIERLKSEQAEIAEEITDIYRQAKSQGYNTPAMREFISERAKRRRDPDKWQERQDMLDLYRNALGLDE